MNTKTGTKRFWLPNQRNPRVQKVVPPPKKTIYIHKRPPTNPAVVGHIYLNLAMNSYHSHRTHSQIQDAETQPFTILPPGSGLLPISASIDNDTFLELIKARNTIRDRWIQESTACAKESQIMASSFNITSTCTQVSAGKLALYRSVQIDC